MSWNFTFKTSTVLTPLCPVPILPKPSFSKVVIYVCGNFCYLWRTYSRTYSRWNLEERWPDTSLHLFWRSLPAAQPPPFTSANSDSMDSVGTQGITPFQAQLLLRSWRLRASPPGQWGQSLNWRGPGGGFPLDTRRDGIFIPGHDYN